MEEDSSAGKQAKEHIYCILGLCHRSRLEMLNCCSVVLQTEELAPDMLLGHGGVLLCNGANYGADILLFVFAPSFSFQNAKLLL